MAHQIKRYRILLGGLDVSGDMNAVEMAGTRPARDDTTFDCTARKYLPGMPVMTVSGAGFVTYGAGLQDATMAAQLAQTNEALVDQLFTLVPGYAAAVSDPCFFMKTAIAEYSPFTAGLDEILGFTVQAAGRGDRWVRGQVFHNSAETVTGTGTIINLSGGVATGKSLYAGLHVIAPITGTDTPTVTVKIQSAALVGFGSPADRITFTAATAVGGQYKSAAGPITDAYYRATWTISGTNPSLPFVVVVGIQ